MKICSPTFGQALLPPLLGYFSRVSGQASSLGCWRVSRSTSDSRRLVEAMVRSAMAVMHVLPRTESCLPALQLVALPYKRSLIKWKFFFSSSNQSDILKGIKGTSEGGAPYFLDIDVNSFSLSATLMLPSCIGEINSKVSAFPAKSCEKEFSGDPKTKI